MTADHVPLREFIERIIAENNIRRDDLRIEDRRWIEAHAVNVSKALELQAREYERRLQDLNHAHAEAQRVLATYLPREVYERSLSELVEWQRKADVRAVETDNRIKSVELGLVNLPGGVKSLEIGLAQQTGQQTGTNMTRSSAITVGALIVAAIGVLVGAAGYFAK